MSTCLPVSVEFVLSLLNGNHFQPRSRSRSWLSVLLFQVSPVGSCWGSAVSGAACVAAWLGVWGCLWAQPWAAESPKPQSCWRWWPCKTPCNLQHKTNLKTASALRNLPQGSSAPTHREFILLVPNPCALPLLNYCLDVD